MSESIQILKNCKEDRSYYIMNVLYMEDSMQSQRTNPLVPDGKT
jgi:hypothetical protein